MIAADVHLLNQMTCPGLNVKIHSGLFFVLANKMLILHGKWRMQNPRRSMSFIHTGAVSCCKVCAEGLGAARSVRLIFRNDTGIRNDRKN